MNTKQLMTIISDLPIKQRAEKARQILQGLNTPDPAVEQAWMDEVARRTMKVDSSGVVEMIPRDQVMQRFRSITQK